MKIAQLFILILAFLMISPAKAGLLIEPVVGYNASGKVKIESRPESKAHGIGYGGRLGYQNLGFQLGLDYLKSTLNMSSSKFTKDVDTSEFGAFIGFEFPILLRIYAGYIFSATGTSSYNDAAVTKKLEFMDGTGQKIGLGITTLPFLDINFEYRRGTFGDYKLDGVKQSKEADFNSFMVGISLPFVL